MVDMQPQSRRRSTQDELSIRAGVQELLNAGIIEPSKSQWRARVLATSNEHHKKSVGYRL